jgi:hypothetical protein
VEKKREIKKRHEYYILDSDMKVKPVDDVSEWAKWFETGNKIVRQNNILGIFVSTVFLGLNHRFGDGEPLLFETMIFNGSNDQYQERYTTREEALKGHKIAMQLVIRSLPKELGLAIKKLLSKD